MASPLPGPGSGETKEDVFNPSLTELNRSILDGDMDRFQLLLESMNKDVDLTEILIDSIYCHQLPNQFDIFKSVLSRSDPKTQDSLALRNAARYGALDHLRILIPLSDPKAKESRALQNAARFGHLLCVKALIPVSDPCAKESRALLNATRNKHVDCVRALVPVSRPGDNNAAALRAAVENNDVACVLALAMFSNLFWEGASILELARKLNHTKCEEVIAMCSHYFHDVAPEIINKFVQESQSTLLGFREVYDVYSCACHPESLPPPFCDIEGVPETRFCWWCV